MGNDVVGLAATLELPLAGRDAYAQRFPGLLPGRLGTWEALELLMLIIVAAWIVPTLLVIVVIVLNGRRGSNKPQQMMQQPIMQQQQPMQQPYPAQRPQQHPAAPHNRFAPQGNQERK